jgi:hypothetical protein
MLFVGYEQATRPPLDFPEIFPSDKYHMDQPDGQL